MKTFFNNFLLCTQIVPLTINYRVPDQAYDLNYVVSEKQPHKINNAISNSFAFGGSDALLIISSSSSGKSR